MIPKADGSQRPLGIPTIRDRVAQMAVKLIIEPIFEADFCDSSYGFRPKKSAHDAVDDVAHSLNKGYTEVIDADLSKYFDTIPHANLMAVVAERISDGEILRLIKMWLQNPEYTGHPIRFQLDTQSGTDWTVIPVLSGHRFRF